MVLFNNKLTVPLLPLGEEAKNISLVDSASISPGRGVSGGVPSPSASPGGLLTRGTASPGGMQGFEAQACKLSVSTHAPKKK